MQKYHTSQGPLEDFVEMQKYQYFPGYYTGGRIHSFFKSHSKIGKYLLLCLGTVVIAESIFILLSGISDPQEIIFILPSAIVALSLGSLCLAAGMKMTTHPHRAG